MEMLIVDRFEGSWAVIEYGPGRTFAVPRALLPGEVREGDVLTFSCAVEREETGKRRQRVKGWLEELASEDQGGDIEL